MDGCTVSQTPYMSYGYVSCWSLTVRIHVFTSLLVQLDSNFFVLITGLSNCPFWYVSLLCICPHLSSSLSLPSGDMDGFKSLSFVVHVYMCMYMQWYRAMAQGYRFGLSTMRIQVGILCCGVKTLGKFFHTSLLQFTQLYKWESGYRQWWICVRAVFTHCIFPSRKGASPHDCCLASDRMTVTHRRHYGVFASTASGTSWGRLVSVLSLVRPRLQWVLASTWLSSLHLLAQHSQPLHCFVTLSGVQHGLPKPTFSLVNIVHGSKNG